MVIEIKYETFEKKVLSKKDFFITNFTFKKIFSQIYCSNVKICQWECILVIVKLVNSLPKLSINVISHTKSPLK